MEALAQDTVVDGAIMDARKWPTRSPKIFEIEKIKTEECRDIGSGHSVIVKRVPLPLMTEEELTTGFHRSQHTFRSTSPT